MASVISITSILYSNAPWTLRYQYHFLIKVQRLKLKKDKIFFQFLQILREKRNNKMFFYAKKSLLLVFQLSFLFRVAVLFLLSLISRAGSEGASSMRILIQEVSHNEDLWRSETLYGTKLLKVSKVFHIIFRLNQPNCKERIFIDKDDSGQINSKN